MAELDIVIPVYNEGDNIIAVLDALRREVKTPFRVLICYDFEEDNTLTAIRGYGGGLDIVPVRNHQRGPHAAVRAGFAASTAPAVLVYMADDDFNAGIIDRMVEHWRGGCDVVAASRFVEGGCMVGCAPFKEAVTRVADFTLYHLCRLKVHDSTNGFRLFSRRVIDTIEIESHLGFTYSIELLAKAVRLGWKVAEVPAQWFERTDKPSRFQVIRWIPRYLRWLFYGLATTFLLRGPDTVTRKAPPAQAPALAAPAAAVRETETV